MALSVLDNGGAAPGQNPECVALTGDHGLKLTAAFLVPVGPDGSLIGESTLSARRTSLSGRCGGPLRGRWVQADGGDEEPRAGAHGYRVRPQNLGSSRGARATHRRGGSAYVR